MGETFEPSVLADELWHRLKNAVKGKVYSNVTDDTLTIVIKYDDIKFEEKFADVSKNMCYGNYTCDSLYQRIIHDYRYQLNKIYYKKHFYEGERNAVTVG